MKHAFRMGLSCITLSALVACGGGIDFESPGTLDVSWAIGGSTCSASGVSTVRISLFDEGGGLSGEPLLLTTETVACMLGRLEIPQVPAGRYTVQVDGFRANSDSATYAGSVSGIEVREGTLSIAPTIEMAEKPGGLDVVWGFENGRLCGFNGVDTVVINIWDTHSNRIYEESLPCDPQLALSEAERTVPSRQLYDDSIGVVIDRLYTGQYTLRAFAMKAGVDLHPKYWAEAKPSVTHSTLTTVDLRLKSCEGMGICF